MLKAGIMPQTEVLLLSLSCEQGHLFLRLQVTKQRSSPLVVHACTSTTNPQTLFGWWSLGYRYAAAHSPVCAAAR